MDDYCKCVTVHVRERGKENYDNSCIQGAAIILLNSKDGKKIKIGRLKLEF